MGRGPRPGDSQPTPAKAGSVAMPRDGETMSPSQLPGPFTPRRMRAASTLHRRDEPAATGPLLASLGVRGFTRLEPVVLAALVTEDPLLLIGRSGTGKTFLLNTLSEALGLEHRHYNASLISFDDLVGFPYPDKDGKGVRFLETPATVWSAESVLVDEISRCKPEHQNRLFSLVHERRVQGMPLSRLRYRWAAMNPCSADQDGIGVLRRLGAARPGARGSLRPVRRGGRLGRPGGGRAARHRRPGRRRGGWRRGVAICASASRAGGRSSSSARSAAPSGSSPTSRPR